MKIEYDEKNFRWKCYSIYKSSVIFVRIPLFLLNGFTYI